MIEQEKCQAIQAKKTKPSSLLVVLIEVEELSDFFLFFGEKKKKFSILGSPYPLASASHRTLYFFQKPSPSLSDPTSFVRREYVRFRECIPPNIRLTGVDQYAPHTIVSRRFLIRGQPGSCDNARPLFQDMLPQLWRDVHRLRELVYPLVGPGGVNHAAGHEVLLPRWDDWLHGG